MTWFTKKRPEPVLNWRLVKFARLCDDCESVYVETAVPMIRVSCEKCQAAFAWVDSLPYRVQDRYLNELEYDLDS